MVVVSDLAWPAAPPPIPLNQAPFWNNERFNKLLIEARSELDQSRRREMYAEMQKLIRDDGGIILPFFADNVDAGGKKLKFENLSGQSSLDGFRCSERWWFEST